MTSKKDLKEDIDQLKKKSDEDSVVFPYRHPETDALYDRFKQQIDPNQMEIMFVVPWDMAPFVVEREKAKTEGWNIVRSIPDDKREPPRDLVEVSEWCINPWVDNPDHREYYTDD